MEFSSENLIHLLKKIKKSIEDGTMDENTQMCVWNMLTWDPNDDQNNEMTKYLFTGWWIHSNLQELQTEP